MIFVTVGTQLPFDRLLKLIEESYDSINEEILAQAGHSSIKANNFTINSTFSREEFESIFSKADIIISHAGMGTILTALKYNKKLIIFPRLSQYKEHRNDHQIATANYMKSLPNVLVARDEIELLDCIQQFKKIDMSVSPQTTNRKQFISNLSSYIDKQIKD
jgi:UDP-N-acetylglucosamine transferase subunit ALG13